MPIFVFATIRKVPKTIPPIGEQTTSVRCPLSGGKAGPPRYAHKARAVQRCSQPKERFLSGNVRALHRIFGEARRSHSRTSAFGGKADMVIALHMSANDPKQILDTAESR